MSPAEKEKIENLEANMVIIGSGGGLVAAQVARKAPEELCASAGDRSGGVHRGCALGSCAGTDAGKWTGEGDYATQDPGYRRAFHRAADWPLAAQPEEAGAPGSGRERSADVPF